MPKRCSNKAKTNIPMPAPNIVPDYPDISKSPDDKTSDNNQERPEQYRSGLSYYFIESIPTYSSRNYGILIFQRFNRFLHNIIVHNKTVSDIGNLSSDCLKSFFLIDRYRIGIVPIDREPYRP